MRTTTIIDGKLCIEQDGTKIWLSLAIIDNYIARIKTELHEWQERRTLLTTPAESHNQTKPDGNNCAICGDNDHQAFECHHGMSAPDITEAHT